MNDDILEAQEKVQRAHAILATLHKQVVIVEAAVREFEKELEAVEYAELEAMSGPWDTDCHHCLFCGSTGLFLYEPSHLCRTCEVRDDLAPTNFKSVLTRWWLMGDEEI